MNITEKEIKEFLKMENNENFDHIDYVENYGKKYNFYFYKKENIIIIVNFNQQLMDFLLLQAIDKIYHKFDYKKSFLNKNIEKLKFKAPLKILCIDQLDIKYSKLEFFSLKEIKETLKENSDIVFPSIFMA